MVIEIDHGPKQSECEEDKYPNGQTVSGGGWFRIVRVRTRRRMHLASWFWLSLFAVRIHYWFVLAAAASVGAAAVAVVVSLVGLGFGFSGASKIGVSARRLIKYSTRAVASRVGTTS